MSASDMMSLLMMEARLDPKLDSYDNNTIVLLLTRSNILGMISAASDLTNKFTNMEACDFSKLI